MVYLVFVEHSNVEDALAGLLDLLVELAKVGDTFLSGYGKKAGKRRACQRAALS